MTSLVVSNAVLWLAVAALAVALYSMARLIREFFTVADRDGSAAVQILAVGSQAPVVNEPAISGDMARLRLGEDENSYLLFTSSSCLVCEHLLGELVKHAAELTSLRGAFIVLNNAKTGMSPQWVGFRLAGTSVQVVAQSAMYKAYRVPTYPYLVRVGGDGKIASHRAVAEWSDVCEELSLAHAALYKMDL